MTPPNDQPDITQPQKDFFDDASFKTLYGGVVVTWVATSAISDVWGDLDLKMLGFTVAITVAFVGFFLSEQKNLKKFMIAPFNGLLIYLTIMGGTSFLPAEVDNREISAAGDTTQTEVSEASGMSAFLKAWNPNRNLVEQATELKQENRELEVRTEQLQQVNLAYESQLENTRQVIRELEVNPEIRENLMRNLDVNRNATLMNNSIRQ